jgi:hypothetical protein
MAPSSKFDRSVGRRLQTATSGWSSCLSWFSLADIRDHKFQQLTPTPMPTSRAMTSKSRTRTRW